MSRSVVAALLALSAVACKQRDPDAAGLLSDGTQTPTAENTAPAGDYTIGCRAQDPDLPQDVFTLVVHGAASATDETQALSVTVLRRYADAARGVAELARAEAGRGAVRPKGPIFVGFQSGALTAEYTAAGALETHNGLLTLASDPAVNGLSVGCAVSEGVASDAVLPSDRKP
jgi:hypothetical protein